MVIKKAILASGGGTAATSAVVVPAVINHSDTLEEDKVNEGIRQISNESSSRNQLRPNLTNLSRQITWDLNLNTKESYLQETFNKPGDCVKKAFPGIKSTTATFNKPTSRLTELDKTFNYVDANKSLSSPDVACLIINKPTGKNSKEFKLELVIKKGNQGWIWISGAQKNSSGRHNFHFREVLVKLENGRWIGEVGLDGKEDNVTQDLRPTLDQDHFSNLKTRDITECTGTSNKCTIKESQAAIWINKETSNKGFLPSNLGNLTKSILPFTEERNHDKKGRNKRISIYQGGKWHRDKTDQGTVISFDKSKVFPITMKGEWTDLIDFCKETTNETYTSSFDTYCK